MKQKPKHASNQETIVFENLDLQLSGDHRFVFYDYTGGKKDTKLFSFWFNTNFVDSITLTLLLHKVDIDKACKDKTHKGKHLIMLIHFQNMMPILLWNSNLN